MAQDGGIEKGAQGLVGKVMSVRRMEAGGSGRADARIPAVGETVSVAELMAQFPGARVQTMNAGGGHGAGSAQFLGTRFASNGIDYGATTVRTASASMGTITRVMISAAGAIIVLAVGLLFL